MASKRPRPTPEKEEPRAKKRAATGAAIEGQVDNRFPSYFKGDIVSILVGKKRESYQVHANLLKCSTYFRKKLYPNGVETSCLEVFAIHLPLSTAQFEIVLSWLYRGIVPSISTASSKTTGDELKRYLYLYVNASRWGMFDFQNAIMDTIRACFTSTSSVSYFSDFVIKWVYKHVDAKAPLRRYVVDLCAYIMCDWSIKERRTYMKNKMRNATQDFVLDLCETPNPTAGITIKREDPSQNAKDAYHHLIPSGQRCKAEPFEEPQGVRGKVDRRAVPNGGHSEGQSDKAKQTFTVPSRISGPIASQAKLRRSVRKERISPVYDDDESWPSSEDWDERNEEWDEEDEDGDGDEDESVEGDRDDQEGIWNEEDDQE